MCSSHILPIDNMITQNQLIKSGRKKKLYKCKTPALRKNPQKTAECIKILQKSPKKPNSAVRKVAKIKIKFRLYHLRSIEDVKNPKEEVILEAYIPGEAHSFKVSNLALIRGGRTPDLPGLKYKLIPGTLNFNGPQNRKTSRSQYGIKKIEKKK